MLVQCVNKLLLIRRHVALRGQRMTVQQHRLRGRGCQSTLGSVFR